MTSFSRGSTPLAGFNVLTLGANVAVRVAGGWLAESGAAVTSYRGDWTNPAPGSPEAMFEQQVSNKVEVLSTIPSGSFDAIVADTESLAGAGEIDVSAPVTVEITSPLAPADFDATLLSDMRLWARSGLGYLTRDIGPDWELAAPSLPLNRQPSILAGIAAAAAATATSLEEGQSERHIAVDIFELLALLPMQPIAFAQLTNRIVGKDRPPAFPGGTMPTANGTAYVRPVEPDHWATLLRLIGGLDWAAEGVVDGFPFLRANAVEIDARMREWALGYTSEEISDLCQAEHIPVAPVYDPKQVLTDKHLNEREFFWNRDGEQGINLPWLADVRTPATAGTSHTAPLRPSSKLPLEGMRILDLSWAWAGPFATTLLTDLGAEVINVEWHPRQSNLRRNAPFAQDRSDSFNTAAWWSANQRGKYSIGVNMKSEAGRKIIRELAAEADAVVENFSPGVVDRLGVGFDELVKINPRLVYVSLSAFGQVGPRSHYIGYGTQVYASSGAAYATSRDGVTQSQMFIPYPDPVSGLAGTFAIAAFVKNARRTGQPARVDVSELEVVSAIVIEPIVAAIHDAPFGDAPYEIEERAQGEYQLSLEGGVAPLADSAAVLNDPYLNERGFWEPDQSPEVAPSGVLIGGSIWHVDGERARIWRGSPQLFDDTRDVLTGLLGYRDDEVAELMANGEIA